MVINMTNDPVKIPNWKAQQTEIALLNVGGIDAGVGIGPDGQIQPPVYNLNQMRAYSIH